MLEKNPAKRLTAKQTLEHPWMKQDTKSTSTASTSSLPTDQQSPKPSLRDSAERPGNKNALRLSLNRSIEAQRDGIHKLKAVSESSLWKKRMKNREDSPPSRVSVGEEGSEGQSDEGSGASQQGVQLLWMSQQ